MFVFFWRFLVSLEQTEVPGAEVNDLSPTSKLTKELNSNPYSALVKRICVFFPALYYISYIPGTRLTTLLLVLSSYTRIKFSHRKVYKLFRVTTSSI